MEDEGLKNVKSIESESVDTVEKQEPKQGGKRRKKGLKVLFGILIGLIVFMGLVHCYFFLPVSDYMRNSERTFTIPDSNQGFIAQGITYDESTDEFFLTGYMKDGSASPIYIVKKETYECIQKVLMVNQDGSAFDGHCGGIACLNGKIYIAGSSDYCIYEFDEQKIRTAEQESCVAYDKVLELSNGDNLKVAYLTTANGLLYAGEFYREENYKTDEQHRVETADGVSNAYLVGFKVEENGLKPVEVYSTPDKIQGAAFSGDCLYLSSSYAVAFSKLYQYKLEDIKAVGTGIVQGTEVPHYILDRDSLKKTGKISPMSEEIEIVDGKMYIMSESASNKYIFGKLLGAWKVYATDMEGFFEDTSYNGRASDCSGVSDNGGASDDGEASYDGKTAENGEASYNGEAADNGIIIVTDQAGRTVTFEGQAESIVSCYYITTYAAMALGIDDKLLGIESKADTRDIYHMANEELISLPAVGTMKELNLEKVAELNPDVVLMPKKLKDYADTLEQLGIKTLVVNPESSDELQEMLRLIGKVCGAEEKGEQLIGYYKDSENRVKALTEGVSKKRTVVCSNSSYLAVAPNDMYQATLMEAAGGVNAAADLDGDYWVDISYEKMLEMNPDVIIIPCNASYGKQDILGDENLSVLSAVKSGSVYSMPGNIEEWDSPVPSGVLGMLWMTSVLNPEKYGYEEFRDDATEFYKEFYGFNIDKALITEP